MSKHQPLTTIFGWILCVATLCLVNAPAIGFANEDAYESVLESTVFIVSKKKDGSFSRGSGVLVDVSNRLIVTNDHVVTGADSIKVVFPEIRHDGVVAETKAYATRIEKIGIDAKVARADKSRDLAILKLDSLPSGISAIPFGEPARPGQEVHAIGNPGASDALWIYSYGRVRARYYRNFQSDNEAKQFQALETQIPINKGDSGGPVFNDNGELVAITQGFLPNSRGFTLSIDISEVMWLLDKNEGDPLADEIDDNKPSLKDIGFFSK